GRTGGFARCRTQHIHRRLADSVGQFVDDGPAAIAVAIAVAAVLFRLFCVLVLLRPRVVFFSHLRSSCRFMVVGLDWTCSPARERDKPAPPGWRGVSGAGSARACLCSLAGRGWLSA